MAVSNGPDTCRSVPKPDERQLPHSMNAYSVPEAAVTGFGKRTLRNMEFS